MGSREILRSNFLIVYQDLVNATNEYINTGHCRGETAKIDAYLAATIHSIIDYSDRFWGDSTEVIKACKYANNTLKHNQSLVSHKKITGGVHFPIHFPLEISPIMVVWNYNHHVETRSSAQQYAFEQLFAGREIIETFQPLLERIREDGGLE